LSPAVVITNFEFDIIHKPGIQNRSDPLSRRKYPEPTEEQIARGYTLQNDCTTDTFLQAVKEGYLKDHYYQETNKINLRHQKFHQENGLWYCNKRLCIPNDDSLKTYIFNQLHDLPTGGHLSREKTLESITRRFFWPSLRKETILYCKTCPTCLRSKHENKKPAGLMQPIPTPDYPWQQVTMDLLLKLPNTINGHNAAVVFVDRLTKMVRWEPCNITVTAEGVAKIYINTIIRNHGFPKVLISDRDPRFISGFWQELQKLIGTKLKMSTAAHAQTDGQTENANKTLLQLLRSYAGNNPNNWDELLALAELAYNSHIQQSTGKSPFYCNHGRHPDMPIDGILPTDINGVEQLINNIHKALTEIKEKLTKSQEQQRKQANKKRRDITYQEGDKVLVSSKLFQLKQKEHKKVVPPYMGPYTITKVTSPVNVQLDFPQNIRIHNIIHVSNLKPWYDTYRFGNRGAPPPFDLIQGEPEYEVETLLARRVVRGERKYLVKWVNMDHCENCWIRERFLNNARDMVEDYDRAHPV
jgi:hypothetical protein